MFRVHSHYLRNVLRHSLRAIRRIFTPRRMPMTWQINGNQRNVQRQCNGVPRVSVLATAVH